MKERIVLRFLQASALHEKAKNLQNRKVLVRKGIRVLQVPLNLDGKKLYLSFLDPQKSDDKCFIIYQ
jgi:hypothetical protein